MAIRIGNKGGKLHFGPEKEHPADGPGEPRRKTRSVPGSLGLLHRSHPIRNAAAEISATLRPRISLGDLPSSRNTEVTPAEARPEAFADFLRARMNHLADHDVTGLAHEPPLFLDLPLSIFDPAFGDLADRVARGEPLPPAQESVTPSNEEADRAALQAPVLANRLSILPDPRARYRFAKELTTAQRTALESHLMVRAMDPRTPAETRIQLVGDYVAVQHARLTTKSAAAKAAHDAQPWIKRALASPESRRRYALESERPEYDQAISNLVSVHRLARELTISEGGGAAEVSNQMLRSVDASLDNLSRLIHPDHLARVQGVHLPSPGEVPQLPFPLEVFTEIAHHVADDPDQLEGARNLARMEQASQGLQFAVKEARKASAPGVSLQASQAVLRHGVNKLTIASVLANYPHVAVPRDIDRDQTNYLLRQFGQATSETLRNTKSLQLDLSHGFMVDMNVAGFDGIHRASIHHRRRTLDAVRNLSQHGRSDLDLTLAVNLGVVPEPGRDAQFITDLLGQQDSKLKTFKVGGGRASGAVEQALLNAVQSPGCPLVELTYRMAGSPEFQAGLLQAAAMQGSRLERLHLASQNASLGTVPIAQALGSPGNGLKELEFMSGNMNAAEASTLCTGLKNVHAHALEDLSIVLPRGLDGAALGRELVDALTHVRATGNAAADQAANAGGVKNLGLHNILRKTEFNRLVNELAQGMQTHGASFPLRSLALNVNFRDVSMGRLATLVTAAGQTPMEVLDLRPIDLSGPHAEPVRQAVEQLQQNGSRLRVLSGED